VQLNLRSLQKFNELLLLSFAKNNSEMRQLIIDMDGVLADVYSQFQKYEKRETGKELTVEEIEGKAELEAFPNGEKHVNMDGFFRTAPVIEGSVSGLKYLNEKYKLLIVSLATEYPKSLKEKMDWMKENYSFISWKQIFLCGDKSQIKGDVMIDDHLKNLNFFDGEKILFSQPHNILIEHPDYRRVKNWEEVVELF